MLSKNITLITGFLFLINFIGILIWPLELVNLRLSLWTFSAMSLLLLSVFYTKGVVAIIFKILVLLFFIIGLFNADNVTLALALTDLSFWGIIAAPLLIKRIDYIGISKVIFVVVILSSIFIAMSIPYLNYSVIFSGEEYSRKETILELYEGYGDIGYYIYIVHGIIYSLLGVILLLLPLMRNIMSRSIVRIIFISIIAIYLLYSMYYLKRQAFTELAVILLIYLFLYKKLYNFIVPTFVFRTALAIVVVMFMSSVFLFTSLFARFQSDIQDINNFDRIVELGKVFKDFNGFDYIFGKGMAYQYKEGYGGGSIVHIGFANLVFKGGILLFFFYIYNIFKNIVYCFKMKKYNSNFMIGVGFSVFTFFHLLIAPGFGPTMNVILIGLGLFSRYPLDFLLNTKNLTSIKVAESDKNRSIQVN